MITGELCEARLDSRPVLVPESGRGALRRIFVRFAEVIGFHVPVGYQDETGFHFGLNAGPEESNSILLVPQPTWNREQKPGQRARVEF